MDYAYITKTAGREINEDSVAVCEVDGNYCFVVADGLGGHGRGEEASSLVTARITEYFRQTDHTVNCIEPAIDYAQQELLKEQKRKLALAEMKTTVVVLVIERNGLYRWGYVGDSRLYLFRKNKIKQRTQDHSVPQMLALAGDICEDEIRFHPDRNKLLRVLGVPWTRTMYDVSKSEKLKRKRAFLLCTDGFWELIDEMHMCDCCKESDSAGLWLEKMEHIVLKNGAEKEMDNYSAVAVLY